MFNRGKKKKRKKRVPMKRIVYLMERKTNREWRTLFSFKKEIKIGITKDLEERHKTVNAGIPGKVVVLEKYLLERASTVEAALHEKYKESNFKVKGAKRNAGGTEFFRISNVELNQIKKELSERTKTGRSIFDNITLFVLAILLLLIIANF